jgi:hypothetical protein
MGKGIKEGIKHGIKPKIFGISKRQYATMEKSCQQPRLLEPIPKRTFFRELGFFSKNRRE